MESRCLSSLPIPQQHDGRALSRRSTVEISRAELLQGAPRQGGESGARPEVCRFRTLAEYTAATHRDAHSVLVDYDIFANVPKPDAQDLRRVQALYKGEDFDFQLKPAPPLWIVAWCFPM